MGASLPAAQQTVREGGPTAPPHLSGRACSCPRSQEEREAARWRPAARPCTGPCLRKPGLERAWLAGAPMPPGPVRAHGRGAESLPTSTTGQREPTWLLWGPGLGRLGRGRSLQPVILCHLWVPIQRQQEPMRERGWSNSGRTIWGSRIAGDRPLRMATGDHVVAGHEARPGLGSAAGAPIGLCSCQGPKWAQKPRAAPPGSTSPYWGV